MKCETPFVKKCPQSTPVNDEIPVPEFIPVFSLFMVKKSSMYIFQAIACNLDIIFYRNSKCSFDRKCDTKRKRGRVAGRRKP